MPDQNWDCDNVNMIHFKRQQAALKQRQAALTGPCPFSVQSDSQLFTSFLFSMIPWVQSVSAGIEGLNSQSTGCYMTHRRTIHSCNWECAVSVGLGISLCDATLQLCCLFCRLHPAERSENHKSVQQCAQKWSHRAVFSDEL